MPDLIELVKACGHDENKGRYKIGLDVSCSVGDGNAVVDEPAAGGDQETKPYLKKIAGHAILIHRGNMPHEECGDIKSLLGMEVIGITKARCKSCPHKKYGTKCLRVLLSCGTYLCLAPLPNSIVTE